MHFGTKTKGQLKKEATKIHEENITHGVKGV